MKIKKLIPLLFAAVCLTACAQIPPVKEPVPEEQQKTVAPPEDGWTAEELLSVTYFDGIELCYPLRLRDLGSAYALDKSWLNMQGRRVYPLIGDSFSSVHCAYVFFDHDEEKASADDEIMALSLYSDNFSVNKLNIYSTEADVEKILGTPDEINDDDAFNKRYYFCDSETGEDLLCVFVGKEEENVTGVAIFLE